MSKLTCQELVELVTAYLDGTLDPGTRRRFVAHLASCDGCVRYLNQFRETIEQLGHLPEKSLPDDVRDALLEAFRDWRTPDEQERNTDS